MLLELERCSVKELCSSFGGSENALIELQDRLAKWLESQLHLPQEIPKQTLKWFLTTNKLNLERAKQKLNMYYTTRRLIPEFFQCRDPRGLRLIAVQNQVQTVLLPKLAPGNYRTMIFRVMEIENGGQVDLWEICKYIFMIGDIRMIEDCCCGENIVLDLSHVSLSVIMKFTPSLLKKCQIAATSGYVWYVKGIHIINASRHVNNVLTLVRAVLHPKLISRIHVYQIGNLEPFFKFVPKSILPMDYGGTEQSMAELAALLKNKIDEWRDWFADQEKIFVNEDLSPTNPASNELPLFGFTGSFRKLEID